MNDLAEDERLDYEERAAILEFDGGHSRARAEEIALAEMLKRRDHEHYEERSEAVVGAA